MIPKPFSVRASITRPANTTQYTAKDVVNGAVAVPLEFKFLTPFPESGFWILGAVLVSNNAPTSTGSFKLLLFREPPDTPVDHAVFAPRTDEMALCIGMIQFDVAIKVSTGTIYLTDGFKPIWGTCLPGGNDIYGVLLDDAGYTPASIESFRLVLNGQWE